MLGGIIQKKVNLWGFFEILIICQDVTPYSFFGVLQFFHGKHLLAPMHDLLHVSHAFFFHGLIVADHRWGFLNGARCSPSPVSSHGPKKVQLWLVASWMWFLIQPVASSDSRFSIRDMESPRSFSEVVLVTAVLALGHSSDGNQKLRRFFMLFWGIWSGVPSGNLT